MDRTNIRQRYRQHSQNSAPALPPASPAVFPPGIELDRHAGCAWMSLAVRSQRVRIRQPRPAGPLPMIVHACACGDGLGLRASRPIRPRAHTGTSVSREALKYRITTHICGLVVITDAFYLFHHYSFLLVIIIIYHCLSLHVISLIPFPLLLINKKSMG